jgi:hypothetical protein
MNTLLPVLSKNQPQVTDQLAEERFIELAVKRLIKQREATILHYEDLGMTAGRSYAASARYLNLQYVANSFWPFYLGYPIPSLIFNDPVVGKKFKKAFGADPFMAWQPEAIINWRTPPSKRYARINEFGEAFILGFIDAVETFWNAVSQLMDACENSTQEPN